MYFLDENISTAGPCPSSGEDCRVEYEEAVAVVATDSAVLVSRLEARSVWFFLFLFLNKERRVLPMHRVLE